MDPITLGIGALGLGMQAFGGFGAAGAAKAAAATSQQEVIQEQNLNNVKQQQMMLSANRQQMETFRNVQRARAQGLNASVQGGSNLGSGLQGGQAQATDQGLYNNLGVKQNVQFGNQIYGIDNTITGLKGQIAQDQSTQATDQAWASFGSSLTKSAGTISNIFGAGTKFATSVNGLFSPGSLSGGYGTT